jgi:ribosomal protein L23
MAQCILIQTEKAYLTQQSGVFQIYFQKSRGEKNKIELEKLFKSINLDVVKINSTNQYGKIKIRGKARRKVTQNRPKKYFVRLKPGQIINEEVINQLNEKLA